MKQYLRSGAAAAVLLLGLTACDNSVLNVTPKDQLSDEVVFADANLAETFLNDIYRGMGHGIYEIMLSSMTDETHFIHNYNTEKVVQSIITPSDRGAVNDNRFNHFDWSDNYSRIRQANTFLQGLEGSEFDAVGVPFEQREMPHAGVYRIKADGAVSMVADFEYPNGLAFSPDGEHLFVSSGDRQLGDTDTLPRHVRVLIRRRSLACRQHD